jgi:hypothetical protein
MKKAVVIAIVVLALLLGGAGVYVMLTKSNGNTLPRVTSSSTPITATNLDACDILTSDIAKAVVGQAVEKVSPATSVIGTADNNVSSCYYVTKSITNGNNTDGPKISGVSLLVYVAKTESGAESNKGQFTDLSSDVQRVTGIGDAAFYNPQFHQLHVLKGNNWYIINNFKDSVLNSDLDSDKQLAAKLNFQ